jgi:hypothetical protein
VDLDVEVPKEVHSDEAVEILMTKLQHGYGDVRRREPEHVESVGCTRWCAIGKKSRDQSEWRIQ